MSHQLPSDGQVQELRRQLQLALQREKELKEQLTERLQMEDQLRNTVNKLQLTIVMNSFPQQQMCPKCETYFDLHESSDIHGLGTGLNALTIEE